MATANIITPANAYGRVSVASVGTTFTALQPTTTQPTSGVIYAQNEAGPWSLLNIMPASSVATGAASIRVTGYNLHTSSTNVLWWMPMTLFEGTLGYTSGTVPTWSVNDTERPFHSVAQSIGTPAANLYTPGLGSGTVTTPASFTVDVAGSQMVVVQFTQAGSPTMSAYWRTL